MRRRSFGANAQMASVKRSDHETCGGAVLRLRTFRDLGAARARARGTCLAEHAQHDQRPTLYFFNHTYIATCCSGSPALDRH